MNPDISIRSHIGAVLLALTVFFCMGGCELSANSSVERVDRELRKCIAVGDSPDHVREATTKIGLQANEPSGLVAHKNATPEEPWEERMWLASGGSYFRLARYAGYVRFIYGPESRLIRWEQDRRSFSL